MSVSLSWRPFPLYSEELNRLYILKSKLVNQDNSGVIAIEWLFKESFHFRSFWLWLAVACYWTELWVRLDSLLENNKSCSMHTISSVASSILLPPTWREWLVYSYVHAWCIYFIDVTMLPWQLLMSSIQGNSHKLICFGSSNINGHFDTTLPTVHVAWN